MLITHLFQQFKKIYAFSINHLKESLENQPIFRSHIVFHPTLANLRKYK